jgi:ribosomal protein L20
MGVVLSEEKEGRAVTSAKGYCVRRGGRSSRLEGGLVERKAIVRGWCSLYIDRKGTDRKLRRLRVSVAGRACRQSGRFG